MDVIDSQVDMDVSMVDSNPVAGMLHDQYCFLCGNGGELMLCNVATCSRAMCIGSSDGECLGLPVNPGFERDDVLFMCPPCHQEGDHISRKPSPYYGFYCDSEITPGGLSSQLAAACPSKSDSLLRIRSLEPLYEKPAIIRGNAQLIPQSKFLSNGVAVLNFRLDAFHLDTGDLGKILQPFASGFFPGEGNGSLIYQHITYNLSERGQEHEERMEDIVSKLREARSYLKTVIVLITTHAENGTGNLGISWTDHIPFDEWMDRVVTRPVLDVIRVLSTHWFCFCCGAVVNVPESKKRVKDFANKSKAENLFAFDATSFHPIYATTFLLAFFQHIIIEGRKFDSAIGLLLNTSPLSRHTGILRFWKDIRNDCVVFRSCELRWAHLRTQPWGRSVPYQCPSCFCIQAWDQQKIHGASSQLRDVSMGCSYKGKQGQRESACKECLTFRKPEEAFKAVKASEGTWVAFGVKTTEFL